MAKAKANGIEIEYDTFGDHSSSPLLLIMGLGAQMIQWEDEFCKQLADKGLYVIRFDNRDVGLSTKFEEAGVPNIMAAITAIMERQEVQSFYSLDDMADDAIGLMDALSIKKAHICGASMGAAITQVIGYRHPSRALSLTPIMGSTGNPDLPQSKPEAMQFLLTPAPVEREAYIEHMVKMQKITWGSFPFDEQDTRKKTAAAYDRGFYPQGVARQLMATIANGNRKPRLSSVTAPTLVIHGAEDPLIPVEGGRDTAEAITGAKLLIIDKMGHSLPKEVWPQIVDAIVKNTSN
jgi:pimeloyl-ACP methyl ester carboxylesterase